MSDGCSEFTNLVEFQEADVALADLTVTSDRARVVSFTVPFMASNIEVLYKPPSPVGDLASLVRGVFSPLSQEVRDTVARRLGGSTQLSLRIRSSIVGAGRKFVNLVRINHGGYSSTSRVFFPLCIDDVASLRT